MLRTFRTFLIRIFLVGTFLVAAKTLIKTHQILILLEVLARSSFSPFSRVVPSAEAVLAVALNSGRLQHVLPRAGVGHDDHRALSANGAADAELSRLGHLRPGCKFRELSSVVTT